MRIDGPPRLAPPVECPYLENRSFVQEYFFGDELDSTEWDYLVSRGWRRFGNFFFRPNCPSCRECTPLRVKAGELALSKSQKRVVEKNSRTQLIVADVEYRDEYYDVYADHSRTRFDKQTDPEEFRTTFFEAAVPSFLTEYRVDGRLAALGFCDRSDSGLSSVYFVYRSEFAELSLGVYSVVRECRLAHELGLEYYYLGYWISQNPSMRYKARYRPHERMDWESERWSASESLTPTEDGSKIAEHE